jgi:hypothetical protein
MNPAQGINWEAVAKWRDELRSGKYKQVLGHMIAVFSDSKDRNDYGYCVLGVFESAVHRKTPLIDDTGYLSSDGSRLLGTGKRVSLFGRAINMLNDTDHLSFDEIADLLDIAILEHESGTPDAELIV